MKVCADSQPNNKKATVLQLKLDVLLNFVKNQHFHHNSVFRHFVIFFAKNEILWSLIMADEAAIFLIFDWHCFGNFARILSQQLYHIPVIICHRILQNHLLVVVNKYFSNSSLLTHLHTYSRSLIQTQQK